MSIDHFINIATDLYLEPFFQNITKQKKTYLEPLCLEPTPCIYLEPLCLEPNKNYTSNLKYNIHQRSAIPPCRNVCLEPLGPIPIYI